MEKERKFNGEVAFLVIALVMVIIVLISYILMNKFLKKEPDENIEYQIYRIGYIEESDVLAKEFILDRSKKLYADLNSEYIDFNNLDLKEKQINDSDLDGYFIIDNIEHFISIKMGEENVTNEFVITTDGNLYALNNKVVDNEPFKLNLIEDYANVKNVSCKETCEITMNDNTTKTVDKNDLTKYFN